MLLDAWDEELVRHGARITLTAGTPFTYTPGFTAPTGGTVAAVDVDVYSPAGTLVDFMTLVLGCCSLRWV